MAEQDVRNLRDAELASLFLETTDGKNYRRVKGSVKVTQTKKGSVKVLKTTISTTSKKIEFNENAIESYLIHRSDTDIFLGESGNEILPIPKNEKWYFNKLKKGNDNDIYAKTLSGSVDVFTITEV